MSKIIDFYRGEAGNYAGDTLDEILSWTNWALEADHDYIQWLFPSNEPSQMNGDAPVLTREDADLFNTDPAMKNAMLRSFARILDFFGFGVSWTEYEGKTTISIKPLSPTEKRPQPTKAIDSFNHNALRVTRVLKSLRLCGLDEYAKAFFEALKPWKEKHSLNTWSYWKNAAENYLWSVFHGPYPFTPRQLTFPSPEEREPITLRRALQTQIETTRLLTEDDLGSDTGNPVVWNGVILRPNGNFYSSGLGMQVGHKLLVAYIVSVSDSPAPMMIEESEIDFYEKQFKVVRVVDRIPVLERSFTVN